MTGDKESIVKKNSNHMWKVAFIIFLILNLILIYNALKAFESGGLFSIGWLIGTIMVMALIDMIGVLVYIYTQQSHGLHGSSRLMSYTVLTVAILALIFSVIIIAALFNLFE